MNINKRCIVNFFSHGRERYQFGTERLITSAKNSGLETDILVFSPEFTSEITQSFLFGDVKTFVGYPKTEQFGECPNHLDIPYLFKAFGIQVAKEMGYEQILWCDSSIVFEKNPNHYFELSKELGVITFDNLKEPEDMWTSDDCLEQLGCSVEEAEKIMQIDAAILFFDFSTQRANDFFNDYINIGNDGISFAGKSGSSRPNFKDHRHDQSVLSYLVKKHYIVPLSYGTWCYREKREGYNPTFIKAGM